MKASVLARGQFLEDVLTGLSSQPKRLPCKYFYDRRGSLLFDEICSTPEYYPTRAEMRVLRSRLGGITALAAPCTELVELGSGSSVKTRILLDGLLLLQSYVGVDISSEHLENAARQLRRDYPALLIEPVAADFIEAVEEDLLQPMVRCPLVFFPGSTIGNFEPHETVKLLAGIGRLLGDQGALLLGVDLVKDRTTIERAYNDAAGKTAKFNLNLLCRINAELGGTFDLDNFGHQAFYNRIENRVEMGLVSWVAQEAAVDERVFYFRRGERILTEYSYKYSRESLAGLAAAAGLEMRMFWSDPDEPFGVAFLTK